VLVTWVVGRKGTAFVFVKHRLILNISVQSLSNGYSTVKYCTHEILVQFTTIASTTANAILFLS
jgi:hypothetical protein